MILTDFQLRVLKLFGFKKKDLQELKDPELLDMKALHRVEDRKLSTSWTIEERRFYILLANALFEVPVGEDIVMDRDWYPVYKQTDSPSIREFVTARGWNRFILIEEYYYYYDGDSERFKKAYIVEL